MLPGRGADPEAIAVVTGFNALLGVELLGERDEAYHLELLVGPQHLHDAGGVHGGVYLSLLDIVMARAARMALPPGSYMPTLELKTNFLASVSQGRIHATGRVISRTTRTCYLEAELVSDTGRLLARASATMIASVPRPPEAPTSGAPAGAA